MNTAVDYSCFVRDNGDRMSLYLQVEGMRCASCAWRIEQALQAHAGVEARINFSTERLRLSWSNDDSAGAANDNPALANLYAAEIEALGFHVAPFDADSRVQQSKSEERFLLGCVAVAGFATLAVMLFTDPLWFLSEAQLNGPTRDLMHWMMGLIAMPATLWCGRPFFRTALSALRHGRTNMDVPISLAVLLANGLSLFETLHHGRYVYFDASVMLLFFLLIGRYLDLKARGRARVAAEGLLAMLEGTASVLRDGRPYAVRIRDIRADETLLAAAGEKIAADGVVADGQSDVDTHLVTGETLPRGIGPGDKVFAGMINMSAPLRITVSAAADDSLLSEIVSLMEKAEQSQSPYVRFADRVAGLYAPVVHGLALATFAGWLIWGAVSHRPVTWEDALLNAMAVLIITCPCALGLAVPVVHVLASSQLFAKGVLVKSGKALEVLSRVDTVVFDKTGTLTEGEPRWLNPEVLQGEDLVLAASMAMQSLHPLSQAIARASAGIAPVPLVVGDLPGQGLRADHGGDALWLGKGAVLGLPPSSDSEIELWFRRSGPGRAGPPIRLRFADVPRIDAAETVLALKARGLRILMLSGDRPAVAEELAIRLHIDAVQAGLSPIDKVAAIEALQADGATVLMVGDGLNDAAALTAARVSMSPSSGIDITQNAADFVYRGSALSPVVATLDIARRTQVLVKQNFAISLVYNVLAVPAAMFGLVTPLIAAVAMSSSSLLVVANGLRLKRERKRNDQRHPVEQGYLGEVTVPASMPPSRLNSDQVI